MLLGVKIGLDPSDIVLAMTLLLFLNKGQSPPKFSAHIYCVQTAAWIKMPLDMEVGLDPGRILLDGDPAPAPSERGHPQFSAHVCCGQTAGWIKMPLDKKIGLGTGRIVLHGDPGSSPSQKGYSTPGFGPCLLWPNGRPSQLLLSTC